MNENNADVFAKEKYTTDKKDTISVMIFVLTLLVIQKTILVESYNLECPPQANWKIRSKLKCNSALKYFCLYNNVEENYVEGCKGPDWDRKGSKRIFSVSFTRGQCIRKRYQPFKFWTNESMSDCIYAKSLCSEEGQIVHSDDSPKYDTTCRCDHIQNYSFIKIPRNVCYCIPTEEDCSCYIKSCPATFTLSTDYNCIPNDYKGKPKCIDTIRNSTTIDEQIEVNTEKHYIYSEHRWNNTIAAVMLLSVCLISLFVIGAFFFATKILHQIKHTEFIIYPKWSRQKLQSSERYIGRGQTGKNETDIRRTESANTLDEMYLSCEDTDETDIRRTESANTINEIYHESYESTTFDETHDNDCVKSSEGLVDVEVHEPLPLTEPTTDEICYLRMIHLIFRVACPVVRLIFNNEIKPTQLQKTLDKYKSKMAKQYRKNEKIINNYQWDLLYGRNKEKTVTSEDFDIRLMVYILRTITNIKVGDVYPVQVDTRSDAMLSRIRYIRNEATEIVDGKLSIDQLKQYWDDIGQAVLTLVSLNIGDIKDNTEKTQLIGRLFALNPVDIDYNKLRKFILMSETYPAMILQQIIFEYGMLKSQSMDDILKKEKHLLYHKRFITESCCVCKTEFSTYTKLIPEKQWKTLYEFKEDSDFHHCPSNLKQCSERFIPKKIDTCDLSITVPIVFNIPDILTHMINLLYTNKFDEFLMNNKHTLYHSMERKRCCMCFKDPSEKTLINKKEWNTLFINKCATSSQNYMNDCCCQYSVKKGIESSNLDETLLSKIFHIAGPISVLNNIEQASFLYFLNWTVDERPLRDALAELLSIIKDTAFSSEMSKSMSYKLNETITEKVDVHKWISTHVKHEKVTPDQPRQILLRDKDGFCTKSVHIPKDFPLPNRTRCFKDITDEENNFLKIFHVLTKIVYSVIKNEFNTLCTDNMLDTIRMDIYEHQITDCRKDSHKDGHKRRRQLIYLTQKQREQLFSPTKEESRNLDLKLMIYILKRKTEEEGKKDYVEQLNVIDNIRREIVQHSSGVLNETKFQDILTLIEKALVHFGKEVYEDKITNLHHIRNVLELL